MLDQKKIGLFICNTRKEQGLTQKQLADEIGISDKAISKWENGRGMPDTSLFPDLCRVLNININELLSGERLSEDAYSGKAEDNMVELIKDSERNRKDSKGTIIGTCVGALLLCLFIYAITIVSGGISGIVWFIDTPSLFAIVGIQFIILGASGQFTRFFGSFKLIFSPKSFSVEDLKTLAEESEYAVTYGIKILLLAGVFACITGLIISLAVVTDSSLIAPNIAVSALPIFYSSLIALFMNIVKGRLHKIT